MDHHGSPESTCGAGFEGKHVAAWGLDGTGPFLLPYCQLMFEHISVSFIVGESRHWQFLFLLSKLVIRISYFSLYFQIYFLGLGFSSMPGRKVYFCTPIDIGPKYPWGDNQFFKKLIIFLNE